MRMPVILLCGTAGSGKDTAADMLIEHSGGVKIAQADPIKEALLALCPDIPRECLWGPSHLRNEPCKPLIEERVRFLKRRFDRLSPAEPFPGTAHGARRILAKAVFVRGKRDLHPTLEHRLDIGLRKAITDERAVTPRYWLQWLGGFVRDLEPDGWALLAHKRAMEALVKGAPFVYITDGRYRNEVLLANQAGFQTWKIVRRTEGVQAGIAGHSSETELGTIPDHWFDRFIYNDGTLGDLRSSLIINMQATYGLWGL